MNSYSTQKIYIIFVTSDNTKKSWGALTEVGAAWITQINHKVFNIADFRPEHPWMMNHNGILALEIRMEI